MRPPLIIITGSPGTGKSTLAKALAKKLGYKRLNLHHYYKRISSRYNAQKQVYDVDKKKFIALVQKKLSQTKKGLIVDSHISHLLSPKRVDLCIVLTCPDLKLLQERLQRRKYFREKIRENLDAEIFQVCLAEAEEQGHRMVVLDSSTSSVLKMSKAIVKIYK